MPTTETQARALVAQLESELMRRRPEIERNGRYYLGEQPLRFASAEFAKFHGNRYANFADNWCQIVSDAPVERLTVNGIQPSGSDGADVESWRIWQENGLDVDSQLAFTGAVNSGRSFVLVWGDPANPDTPEVTFEDASQCIVAYEPGSRRRRRAALKRWEDGEKDFATLYLADEVWRFQRGRIGASHKSPQMRNVDTEINEWAPREVGNEPNPQPNPMGLVPMVEIPNRPTLTGDPISDISGVIALQDAVNLLWAQLFTAADYAAFPQRLVLGAERPMVPILNETGEVVGERPVDLEKFAVDRVLFITGEDAKVDQWAATNLNAYTDIIETAVQHIAAQTRTPPHYLIGKIVNISGDALIAAETGLIKRVDEKGLWFGQAIREMFRLIALAQGDVNKARSLAAGSVMWANAESRSDSQMADALLKLKQIGFPFEFLARRYGLTPTEITDMLAMREREALADPMGAITQMMAQDPQQSVTANADA